MAARAGGPRVSTFLRRHRSVAIALAICFVAAACGTRLSQEEIVAAHHGGTSEAGRGGGVRASGGDRGAGDAEDGAAGAQEGAETAGGNSSGGVAEVVSGDDAEHVPPSGSRATTSGADNSGPTGEPIRIGAIGDWTGIAGASTGANLKALQAWYNYTNDNGGIGGRPVIMYFEDTAADAARARAAARDMAENKKVIAFVGNYQPFTIHATEPDYNRWQLPVVGGDVTQNAFWFDSPILFPQATPPSALDQGIMKLAAERNVKKLGLVYCAEAPACQERRDLYVREAKEWGVEIVYDARVSLANPDFTAQCLGAQQSGANAMVPLIDVSGINRLMRDCTRQGYKPQYIGSAGGTGDSLLRNPASDGMLITTMTFPWTLSGGPFQRYQDAMKRYLPNEPLAGPMSLAWTAGELFRTAAERAIAASPNGELSSQTLLNALWRMKGETLGGLAPPLTFNEGEPATPSRCYFLMEVRDGQFRALDGGKATCL